MTIAAKEARQDEIIGAADTTALGAIAVARAHAGDFEQGAAAPMRAHWPQRMTSICDVISADFKRSGIASVEAERLAGIATLSLAFHLGGRQLYLPLGKRLKDAIRRWQIFRAWQNGEPIEMLRERFQVSHETVYSAIREGRQHDRTGRPA